MILKRMAMFAIIYCGASLLSGCEGHYHDKAERARIAKLSELRKQVSSAFLLGAIGFVCIGLLGPTVTEASRKYVAEQFRLSISDQVFLAKALYWSGISVVLVFSLFNAHLKNVQPAVWLLLGATAYPFFVHVIPSLEAGDKMQR